ncbi:MAG TPA: DNA primase [Ruminiclostridium sp.]|jgi:DNA primase|uniref:DNA primase n=1 Tax=Acetivibrio saccincola TaxID=1677857 RepID=A0A2K9EQL6_9FIRM|nr:DNA primase [Acetivibrio saccincola]HAA42424.1 DNA primase [Ruminiclostridium sp.]AUG57790.1 DNA primase [Acetivibrio saccincola]NLW25839.1 DNA primase [Acetivibrio saccincola]PQQ67675.1 DNA primase [Acetivibrio saccincola]HOA97016.1 DNA primase [Acetivibrio saccincola]
MQRFYPDELIEEIRISNDIISVVGEYIQLKRKGKGFFGLCPFHSEKTPSFHVDPVKQLYYCFGCGNGGSVIQFVMGVENLDYIEAVKFLADKAGILLPEGEDEKYKEIARKKKQILKINVEAARFFYEQIEDEKNSFAREYLASRGIKRRTVRKFGIGYSLKDWDALYKHLKAKGYDDDILLESGLVLKNKSGGYYDRFRGRIIFPIFDLRGNVLGFGGRVLDNSEPKYMNSPETMVYNKRKHLYGLNFAKNSSHKRIIVVEGYMDVISLFQFGIINTVASLGTALTESQGRLLKKYTEEIIISFDADTAGKAATIRGLDILDSIGCNVKVLEMPEGEDPDEFVKKYGADAFNSLINKSLSLVEYKIKALKSEIDTNNTEGKIIFLNKTADVLSKLDNDIEREMYIKKIAKEYEISQESIYAEVLKRIKPKKGFRAVVTNINTKSRFEKDKGKDEYQRAIKNERILLSLISIDNSLFNLVKDKISPESFEDEDNRRIAKAVFERLNSNKGLVPAELINLADNKNSNIFTRLLQEECNFEDNKKAILDIIKKMELFKLTKREREILNVISNSKDKTAEEVRNMKLELQQILYKKKSI